MTLRRATLIIPCHRLDDFPSHLTGDRAADLLAGWTALWHPALIAAIGDVPGWRSSDDLPDPSEFDGELLVLPETSRLRMSADWCDRMRATNPQNPPPVDALPSRAETIAAVLHAAELEGGAINPEFVGDFLALGHAHLQVELLTRAMRYTTVLDNDQFAGATVAAARAAIAGDEHAMREELARAFDLLADARNHVYSVDFYVVDVTLLAPTTLGDALRDKLASGNTTSLLASGELLDQMAAEHPQSLEELRRAIEAGKACLVGGTFHTKPTAINSPEAWLAEINQANAAAQRHLQRDYEVFGMFHTSFSPLLPELLQATGFKGALHASFDGGRLPRTDQTKTWWGPESGRAIIALAATALDASRPETWLKFAERVGDTIAHDHVATILLASWPEANIEYYDDFRRAARYGPVLGRLVTLEEYFRVSQEPDDWTRFHTKQYSPRADTELGSNPISSRVDSFQREVLETHRQLGKGLAASAGLLAAGSNGENTTRPLIVNAWNFPVTCLVGADPLAADAPSSDSQHACIPDVPGWGFATFAAAAPTATVPLAEDRTLRNERIEVTVSETTGGIQSLRTYRDRGTRVSQRLAYHRGRIASADDSQMVAEQVSVTRCDALIGEITSRGKLLDQANEVLANYVQRTRIVRGIPAVYVDIELEPLRMPDGDIWRSYYASRLAWSDDAVAVRRGVNWMSRETGSERIESPEWVEVIDPFGTITCFAFGLPFHRRASPSWLDTLLIVEGEERRRFQFAIALDESYPLRNALGLLTAGRTSIMTLPAEPTISRGWFLHLGAKNIVATHVGPLFSSSNVVSGIRVRLLETEGRDTQTTLAAFRPFTAARTTDFRGNSTAVLSVLEGAAQFPIAAHQWIQIEAEW